MANPYLQVLRTPHALPMVLAAFIGRLPLSMVGLGCVLLVASETGSYGYGGAVAAAGAVTTALAGPVLGRLADSHGQRRVLLPVLAVFVVSGVGVPRRREGGLAGLSSSSSSPASPGPASRRCPR